MAEIGHKIQKALDEGRTLILGAQILVGLQYRSVFEPGFYRLSTVSQYLLLLGLGLILFAFGLLMSPVAYHRIVEHGEDRESFYQFVLGVMRLALLPFALSLGLTLEVAAKKVSGTAAGISVGAGGAIAAIFLWYGLGSIRRHSVRKYSAKLAANGSTSGSSYWGQAEDSSMDPKGFQQQGEVDIHEKVRHVLTEARIVLPGAQALMGFQFVIMVMNEFDKLPKALQEFHLLALVLTAISTIFLITPAAYDRLVEKGRDTEEFYRLASWMVLAAMVPLAAGVSADYYVCARKVIGSEMFPAVTAVFLLLFFYGVWFGLALYRRRRVAG